MYHTCKAVIRKAYFATTCFYSHKYELNFYFKTAIGTFLVVHSVAVSGRHVQSDSEFKETFCCCVASQMMRQSAIKTQGCKGVARCKF